MGNSKLDKAAFSGDDTPSKERPSVGAIFTPSGRKQMRDHAAAKDVDVARFKLRSRMGKPPNHTIDSAISPESTNPTQSSLDLVRGKRPKKK